MKEFKTIEVGNIVQVIDSSLKIYDGLNNGTYYLRFDKNRGNFLEKTDDMKIIEKIYGVQKIKASKVLKTFKAFEKNLGVLMSGDKGIGKSLFTKILMEDGCKQYPVIIIEHNMPGIVQFINSVKQECIVIFDEFDKVFQNKGEDGSEQDRLLSLFDGLSQGKKMFVITCNSIHKVSEFLVNRPGRFHYHFRFGYPTVNETREYLQDKLEQQFHDKIEEVIAFSKKVKLNYDCLRAIVFDLNQGFNFKETIEDLNIMKLENERYKLKIVLEDGSELISSGTYTIDLFDPHALTEVWFNGRAKKYDKPISLYVNVKIPSIKSIEENFLEIDCGDEMRVDYVNSDEKANKIYNNMKIKTLILEKVNKSSDYSYSKYL